MTLLIERLSRLLILAYFPRAKLGRSTAVLRAFTGQLRLIALLIRQLLTRDQGSEMARHKELAAKSTITGYFYDPHISWQRGTGTRP